MVIDTGDNTGDNPVPASAPLHKVWSWYSDNTGDNTRDNTGYNTGYNTGDNNHSNQVWDSCV